MNYYKYSIVIPVYNVEKYLKECIETILNQKYKLYEIILIDDGSTDNSSNICDDYAKEYKNISVIHQKNRGLSNARNTGIDKSTGDYVIFLDSDDIWLSDEALNKINYALYNNNADVLIFDVIKFRNIKEIRKKHMKQKEKKYKTIEDLIKNNIYKANANNKVIRRDFLDKNFLRFQEGLLSEDIDWCSKILEYQATITYLNEYIYGYRQRKNSITHSKNKKHISDILIQCEWAKSKKYKHNEYIILSFFAYEYCTALGIYSLNFYNDKELKTRITNNLSFLNYDLSDKVKKIKLMFKIFGKKISFIILKIFMIIKE